MKKYLPYILSVGFLTSFFVGFNLNLYEPDLTCCTFDDKTGVCTCYVYKNSCYYCKPIRV